MKTFVHLVAGESAAARQAKVARLAAHGRAATVVFAETSEPPTAPIDWLLGPGCVCCLPANHPRLRLMAAMDGPTASRRIIVDAGSPEVAERIAQGIRALPMAFSLGWITA